MLDNGHVNAIDSDNDNGNPDDHVNDNVTAFQGPGRASDPLSWDAFRSQLLWNTVFSLTFLIQLWDMLRTQRNEIHFRHNYNSIRRELKRVGSIYGTRFGPNYIGYISFPSTM